MPETLPAVAGLWHVWKDARHAVMTAGADGVPIGFDLQQVETVARAHGEPFDAVFLERFGVLVDAYLMDAKRKRK